MRAQSLGPKTFGFPQMLFVLILDSLKGLAGLEEDEYYKWFFQWAFAATAATTVSGCMAERTCFCGYLIYAFCITSVIYAIVVHWVWVRGSAAPRRQLSLVHELAIHEVPVAIADVS